MDKLASSPTLFGKEILRPVPCQSRSRYKRAGLIAAATDLFAERGFEGTSVDQIARKADVATGTFYRYFRSKRQLFLMLMNDQLKRLGQLCSLLKGANEPRSEIRTLLTDLFGVGTSHRGAFRAWHEALCSEPEFAIKQKEIEAWTLKQLTALFARLQKRPGTRKHLNLQSLAKLVNLQLWSLMARSAQRRMIESSILY